jgi:hypothetical protein
MEQIHHDHTQRAVNTAMIQVRSISMERVHKARSRAKRVPSVAPAQGGTKRGHEVDGNINQVRSHTQD